MNKLFYLLPSFCACIGVISVLITYYFIWRRLERNKTTLVQTLSQRVNSTEIQKEVSEVLDHKLNHFIHELRSQIPMGSMLLTDSLSRTIKGIAKEEMLKMIPDIKERLVNRLSTEMDIEKIALNSLRSELYRIVLYGAVLGFSLGLLWLLLNPQ